MAEKQTARKKLPYPTSSPGKVSNGAIDIEELAKAEDELNEGHQDFLQAGVVASTHWSLTANINSGTGALGSTGNTGGTAWLPDPVVSGALMRSITTPAMLSGIAPSLLPASGKYVSCAFELTPSTWGAAVTVTAHSGVEKGTEAEAIAAPPGTTAGKMQVRRVIIKNTAGVYSIVAQEDVRPWATGGNVATETAAEGRIGGEAVTNGKVKKGSLKTDRLAVGTVLELLSTGTARKIAWGEYAPSEGFDTTAGRSRWEGQVEHGLGVAPQAVFLTAQPIAIQENGGSPIEAVMISVNSITATKFKVVMTAPGTTNNGTSFYWVAIG